jgi:hypothetical protein
MKCKTLLIDSVDFGLIVLSVPLHPPSHCSYCSYDMSRVILEVTVTRFLKAQGYSVPNINAYGTLPFAVQVATTIVYACECNKI